LKRASPPLLLQLQPQPALQWLMAGAGALAGLSLSLAIIAHFPQFWPLLGLPPVAALWAWRCAGIAPRMLRWDGQEWHLHERLLGAAAFSPSLGEPAPVRIRVIFDLGYFVLLRAHRSARWWARFVYLPLTRSTQGAAWGNLRAVLYSARQGPR
jgi:hypothetical protein